jgi:micrococcal nuclease
MKKDGAPLTAHPRPCSKKVFSYTPRDFLLRAGGGPSRLLPILPFSLSYLDWKRITILLMIFQSLVGFLPATQNTHFDSGRVTTIYDGDTIKVRLTNGGEVRVRLIGIDSPELDDPREEVQFLAQMAKEFAYYHLFGREVRLAYDWEPKDSYGRTLAYVWTDDQKMFNEFIVSEGFAFAFLKFPYRKDYQERFKAAESLARVKGVGLWHKGSYPAVSATEARGSLGKIAAVEFLCSSIQTRMRFSLLLSPAGEFQVLIPSEKLPLFLDLRSFLNRTLIVTGFLGDFRGRTEMRLVSPHQIKIKSGTSPSL